MIRFAFEGKCGASRMPLNGLGVAGRAGGSAEVEGEAAEELPPVHFEIDVRASQSWFLNRRRSGRTRFVPSELLSVTKGNRMSRFRNLALGLVSDQRQERLASLS